MSLNVHDTIAEVRAAIEPCLNHLDNEAWHRMDALTLVDGMSIAYLKAILAICDELDKQNGGRAR